jgi:hypothetical protein
MNEVKTARDYFSIHYAHVAIFQITDQTIMDFFGQKYVKDLTFPRKMGLLYDHLLAQGLCDVTE